ncbi:MAG: hypothetical protein ACR2GP_03725 [Burkholderiaceae bacterium]
MSKQSAVIAAVSALAIALAGCATQQPGGEVAKPQSTGGKLPVTATPTQGPTTIITRSDDSRSGREMIGTPASGSKFSQLKFGMSPQQVTNLIGAPSDSQTHETGKRWIPFYFGPDARRIEVAYKGEGCVTFTGGNRFGSGDNELIKIEVDTQTKCFNN